jgi:hypothetical protein
MTSSTINPPLVFSYTSSGPDKKKIAYQPIYVNMEMETDEKFESELHLIFALSVASYFGQCRSVRQVASFTFLRWYMYGMV